MKCQGVIPERTVATGSEVVEAEPAVFEDREIDGRMLPFTVTPARMERRLLTKTTPEHPCEAEATMLARSMTQRRCNLDGLHWVKDGQDRAYCAGCYRPGTVTTLDGTVTDHPAMSIAEYERA